MGFEGEDGVDTSEFRGVEGDIFEEMDFGGTRSSLGFFFDNCYGGVIAVNGIKLAWVEMPG